MTESNNVAMVMYALLGITALVLVLYFFYLSMLSSLLREISPENRRMNPGMVWLLLVPIFNLIWTFVVVKNISASVKDEFESRGVSLNEQNPGYNIGLVMSIFQIMGLVPIFGRLLTLGFLAFWISYWIKMADYRSKLRALNSVL